MRILKSFAFNFRAALLMFPMLALTIGTLQMHSQITVQPGQSVPDLTQVAKCTFSDYFTNGHSYGWLRINRAWHVYRGRYVLDGGYLSNAIGRDGFTVTHLGDKSCRNYALQATFDITNPAGLPSPDVHNAFFFVRVQSPPPDGTFFRIAVWPKGTLDPRGGPHNGVALPNGLVWIDKYVEGSVVRSVDREYSNSVTGTNEITVKSEANVIRVWINGEYILKFVDDETSSQPVRYGGIGMGAIWEAQAWFDNVVV